MYLHQHLFVKHSDEFVMCETACLVSPAQASEIERREVLLECVEGFARGAPAGVVITGNQIEGYRLTCERVLGCGHVEQVRAELYLSERDCNTESLTEEAGVSHDQYMVVSL